MMQAFALLNQRKKLSASHPAYTGTPVVVCSPAKSFQKKKVVYEWAGAAFHAWHRRVSGVSDQVDAPSRGTSAMTLPGGEEDLEERLLREEYEKKKAKDGVDPDNYYELLGIGHLGMTASEKQIKKAYQQTALKVHPDKNKETGEIDEAANTLFRKVQNAYEVLSNPAQRRGYDSQMEFDEWIPKGTETINDYAQFYKVYGPVFESNARFSTIKPVPLLGLAEDSETKVKNFYTFWRTFNSWREFSADDEHKPSDIETASSRDERRFMIMENENARKKKKKAENQRVQTLVERAYINDPRIAKFKVEAEKAKEDAKRQKEEAKRAEEEKKRLEEEERTRGDREEKERADAERKDKANLKLKVKKAHKRLRDAIQAVLAENPKVAGFDKVESVLEAMKATEDFKMLKELADRIEDSKSFDALLSSTSSSSSSSSQEPKSVQPSPAPSSPSVNTASSSAPAATATTTKKEKIWTQEEMSMLAKGMAKHPGGTRNRWNAIAAYLNTAGFNATPDECIQAAKTFGAPGAKPAIPASTAAAQIVSPPEGDEDEKPWTAEDIKNLQSALVQYPATEHEDKNERWGLIAAVVKTHTKKECAAKFLELKQKALATST